MSAANHLLPDTAPKTVRLHFHQERPRAPLAVEVRETRDDSIVAALPLRAAARWLAQRGYRYVAGTQAMWVREGAR